jgi:hypothetical protein
MGRVHDARWPVRGFSASDYYAEHGLPPDEPGGWWVVYRVVPKCGVEG